MRRLYAQRLTTSSGGNVSCRNAAGYIFITASQTDKSCIKWRDIIVVDPKGENLTPELTPSMEFGMHQEIYNSRSDVFAIVHAHPVYASTFAVSGIHPDSSITGEAQLILGDIAMADYKPMGTKDLASTCAAALTSADTLIMRSHGATCVGSSLFQAFDRMEVLEFTCQIYFNTLMLGRLKGDK